MTTIAGAAMERRRQFAAQREGGAAAILVAASLLALMGFAALAVDLGAGWNERRQDQSASDMAAMVAVQFARGSSNITAAANNGATEARTVANASLDTPFTNAEWAACTDPDRPTRFTRVSGVSPCISFSANLQEARVRTPIAEVATSFGRVLGTASIDTDAAAEAKGSLGTPGGILPFGVPAASANNNLVCLKTGTAPQSFPPCEGPAEGNFGYLDISLFGNADLNTPQVCGNAQRQQKITSNIAVGVDHPLIEYQADGTNQVRNDHTYCPIFNSMPNELPGETGNAFRPALDPGLRDGIYGNPGRLAQGSNRITVVNNTPQLDNTPLWNFLDTSRPLPAACTGVSNTTQMQACMAAWSPAVGPMFRTTIVDNSRFAFVPEFFVNPGPGQQDYLIKDFRAVFLHGTYFQCNANRCTIVFEPGVPSSGNNCANGQGTSCGFPRGGNSAIESLTAFLFKDAMLPQSVQDMFPPGAGSVSYALTR
jgi:hypothetical protein